MTHGLSQTRIYRIYRGVINRCNNPNVEIFEHYGGRGIKLCQEWSDFEVFYKWAIEAGYKDNLTLERIDNDGDYKPDNCRWATMKEQGLNTRNSLLIEYKGNTQTLKEWSDQLGMKYLVLYKRLQRGWSIEKTFTTPLMDTNPRRKS